ncbi:S-type anion channel [Nymphaea thermarum]|nr:S-type anion channel [Nymphaea thermarum]
MGLFINSTNRLCFTTTHKMSRKSDAESHSPFLARFHADFFRVSMALASQAVLWRTLSSGSFSDPWPPIFNSIIEKSFWLLAALVLSSSSLTYLFKSIFYFHIVKAEFLDRWRVNYLFAPWIAAILLLQCVLPSKYDRWRGSSLEDIKFFNWGHLDSLVSRALCCAFTLPILLLELKLYGQWFTKGKRFLSTVANPSTHLSLIGNFVAAQTAARLAWLELGLFLFAIGIIHYVVVFVTLYQRLPCNASFPAQLRPASFLSIAAPSMASVAWESVSGQFDSGCKMLHFLSLFLFTLLVSFNLIITLSSSDLFRRRLRTQASILVGLLLQVVRPTLFVKAMKRFNSAWWAYVFPVTMLALSSAEYAGEVHSGLAHTIRRVISMVSLAMTIGLILLTIVHRKTMFLNDYKLSTSKTRVSPVASPSRTMEEHDSYQTLPL